MKILDSVTQGFVDGALAAVGKRKAKLQADFKRRNLGTLMAGKVPSDQAVFEAQRDNLTSLEKEIREIR